MGLAFIRQEIPCQNKRFGSSTSLAWEKKSDRSVGNYTTVKGWWQRFSGTKMKRKRSRDIFKRLKADECTNTNRSIPVRTGTRNWCSVPIIKPTYWHKTVRRPLSIIIFTPPVFSPAKVSSLDDDGHYRQNGALIYFSEVNSITVLCLHLRITGDNRSIIKF